MGKEYTFLEFNHMPGIFFCLFVFQNVLADGESGCGIWASLPCQASFKLSFFHPCVFNLHLYVKKLRKRRSKILPKVTAFEYKSQNSLGPKSIPFLLHLEVPEGKILITIKICILILKHFQTSLP